MSNHFYRISVVITGKLIFPILCLFLAVSCNNVTQKQEAPNVLFDPSDAGIEQIRGITGDHISLEEGRLTVEFTPGNSTSIIAFLPEQSIWDGSDYRFILCEVENLGPVPRLVELGTVGYDLTQGATIIAPGEKKSVKAVIYRTDHPSHIDELFPVMHGKPDGILRGWMASTSDSISGIKLLFPEIKPHEKVRIGKIWLEEPYVLYTKEELKERYFPFVDRYGQFMFDEWPTKIHTEEELKDYHSLEAQELADSAEPSEWNKYGGWANGPQLEATGRFRVEKMNGKWWFVDPEGRLFWSHGMDCVEFGIQSRTRITGREHYFQYLPGAADPENELYTYTVSGGDTIKWLSFHTLNLFRIYGTEWRAISHNRLHARFRHWGMNTIGNWSDNRIFLQRKTPYVLTAYSRKTGLISDPYADGFREDLISILRSRQEEIGDPWCLGVFIDNELKWGVKWGPKIPEQLLTAPPDQPAKLELIDFLRSKYRDIHQLNQQWGTEFTEWSDLGANQHMIPGAQNDMREFMKKFTSRYYALCREAVKEVDPEMLYLGCRMDFHLYPEDTSLNYIIRIAAEYCDVVSFNRYRYTCSGLVPPDGADYPIIIGEFHFGSLETGLLQPGLRYAADPDERAMFYEHYVRSALRNPYLVGTHWFQLADQAVTGRPDGENYQAGFLTVGDVPQQEIISVSRKLGRQMYQIRSSKNGLSP
jgi:hypothetical protein